MAVLPLPAFKHHSEGDESPPAVVRVKERPWRWSCGGPGLPSGQQKADGRDVYNTPPTHTHTSRYPRHHERHEGMAYPHGLEWSVHWGRGRVLLRQHRAWCGGHAFLLAGFLLQMHSCPGSPRRLLLGMWPHILHVQDELWQSFPPSLPPSHFGGRSHLTD